MCVPGIRAGGWTSKKRVAGGGPLCPHMHDETKPNKRPKLIRILILHPYLPFRINVCRMLGPAHSPTNVSHSSRIFAPESIWILIIAIHLFPLRYLSSRIFGTSKDTGFNWTPPYRRLFDAFAQDKTALIRFEGRAESINTCFVYQDIF